MNFLLDQWLKTCARYSSNTPTAEAIYTDLWKRYNESGRYYHNLNHIQTLLHDIDEYYAGNMPDEVFFATWFHDAVYNTLIGNNEARSAELASEQLALLNVSTELIEQTSTLILKTANHAHAHALDEATQVFLDADLKILGMPAEAYQNYTAQVRVEYQMVPDVLFNKGRRKFLEQMLALPQIFRTAHFANQYEAQARTNLSHELNKLL